MRRISAIRRLFSDGRHASEPDTRPCSAPNDEPADPLAGFGSLETLRLAKRAAWKGQPVQRFFRGALEFAQIKGFNLLFVNGEQLGEIAQDTRAIAKPMRYGFLTVHHEFHPEHRLYYVSDPRCFAPRFPDDLGMFPSRDTAAIALLEALVGAGRLSVIRDGWVDRRGPLQLFGFSSAGLSCPWVRVTYDGRDLAWLLVDPERTGEPTQWYFQGPPALGDRIRCGYFRTREDAALALVEELRQAHANYPQRFAAPEDSVPQHGAQWNRTALELLDRLSRIPGMNRTTSGADYRPLGKARGRKRAG